MDRVKSRVAKSNIKQAIKKYHINKLCGVNP